MYGNEDQQPPSDRGHDQDAASKANAAVPSPAASKPTDLTLYIIFGVAILVFVLVLIIIVKILRRKNPNPNGYTLTSTGN